MTDKPETVEDVLAEMRESANFSLLHGGEDWQSNMDFYRTRIEAALKRRDDALLEVAEQIASRDNGAPITHGFYWDCRCWAHRIRAIVEGK